MKYAIVGNEKWVSVIKLIPMQSFRWDCNMKSRMYLMHAY